MVGQGAYSVHTRKSFSHPWLPDAMPSCPTPVVPVRADVSATFDLYVTRSGCLALENSDLPFAGTMSSADFSTHSDSSALARASDISPPVETSRGKPHLLLYVALDLPL